MNMLKQCIKLNYKMADSQFGGACIIALFMILFLQTFFMILTVIPLSIFAIYLIYKGMKKIFYDSVFGDSAFFYQSLPINGTQMVIGKIFTGSLGFIFFDGAVLLSFILTSIIGGISISALPLGRIDLLFHTSLGSTFFIFYTVFLILYYLVQIFMTFSIVFLSVTLFETLPKRQRKRWVKTLVSFGVIGSLYVENQCIQWIFNLCQWENPFLQLILEVMLGAVILILTAGQIIRLLSRRYSL